MKIKRVTLKDIAAYCGVSPTIVSVVLNGREGHIACADECRRAIREAAEKLGYRPNLLARSMVARQVPLVGVMLHLTEKDFFGGVNEYLQQILPELTFQFNRHGLEVIFVPYSDEKDQVCRAENLTGYGLAGGIVTNIIPGSNRRIGTFLKESAVPHMILGYPDEPEGLCYCYNTIDYPRILKEYIAQRRFKRIYIVTQQEREVAFYQCPLPENYLWHAKETGIGKSERESDDALFLLMGAKIAHLLKKQNKECRHTVLVETSRMEPVLGTDLSYLLMHPRNDLPEVAKQLAAWILQNKMPSKQVFHREYGPEAIAEKHLL